MASVNNNSNNNNNSIMITTPLNDEESRQEYFKKICIEKWREIAGFYDALPLELENPEQFKPKQWNAFYYKMLNEKEQGNIELIKNNGALQKIKDWIDPYRTHDIGQAVLSGKAEAIDCGVQATAFLKGSQDPTNATRSSEIIERGFGLYNSENIEYLEKLLHELDWAKQKVTIQYTKIFKFYPNVDYSENWHHYLLKTLSEDLQEDEYTLVAFLRGKGESGHSVNVAKIKNRLILFDPQRLRDEVKLIDIDYDTNPNGTCLYVQGKPKATNFENYIISQGYKDFELIYKFKEITVINFDEIPELPVVPPVVPLAGSKHGRSNTTIQVSKANEIDHPEKKLHKGNLHLNKSQYRLDPIELELIMEERKKKEEERKMEKFKESYPSIFNKTATFHRGKKTSQNHKSKKRRKGGGKWTKKYKKSINCKKPKGFSQKQHCKYGRKKVKKQTRKMKGGHHELLVAPILVAASYIDKYRNKKYKKQTKKQTKK